MAETTSQAWGEDRDIYPERTCHVELTLKKRGRILQSRIIEPFIDNWYFSKSLDLGVAKVMKADKKDEMPVNGLVFNIQRFSVNDGPGIRTTVFFKGCPLKCVWCHNPESQSPHQEVLYYRHRCMVCGSCADHCPEQAITMNGGAITHLDTCKRCGICVSHCFSDAREMAGQQQTVSDLMHVIKKDHSFYEQSHGGVTLSGGEPLAQPGFAKTLLRLCKQEGYHTALDTCGYADWEKLNDLRFFVDLFLYDLKIIDDRRHRTLAGVSNRLILDNLERLAHKGHRIIIRVPIIPGITDDKENIEAIVDLAKALPNIIRMDILPYHHIAVEKYARLQQEYTLDKCQPPSRQKLLEIKSMIEGAQIPVSIGG